MPYFLVIESSSSLKLDPKHLDCKNVANNYLNSNISFMVLCKSYFYIYSIFIIDDSEIYYHPFLILYIFAWCLWPSIHLNSADNISYSISCSILHLYFHIIQFSRNQIVGINKIYLTFTVITLNLDCKH